MSSEKPGYIFLEYMPTKEAAKVVAKAMRKCGFRKISTKPTSTLPGCWYVEGHGTEQSGLMWIEWKAERLTA